MTKDVIACACLLATAGTVASAEIFPLLVYENADSAPVGAVDLSVEVLEAPGGVDFVFHNESTTPAVVTALYVEAGPIAGQMLDGRIAGQSPGVAFDLGATPPSPPPPGAGFGGPWRGNLLTADADAPGPFKGINHGAGESLTIRFDLDDLTVGDVVGAMSGDSPSLRIAQHVQGLSPGDASVWAVTSSPAPAPGAAPVLALAALGATRRRRRTRR